MGKSIPSDFGELVCARRSTFSECLNNWARRPGRYLMQCSKVLAASALIGCVMSHVSLAQAPVDATPSNAAASPVTRLTQGLLERVSFDIDSFLVSEDNPLSDAKTRSLLAPYVGKDRGIDDIENAADALEKAITTAGFSFFRVSFPPQELTDGVIELMVKSYAIGKVSVSGNKHYADRNIAASLPALKSGKSPNAKAISRALRVANLNAGKRVSVTLSPGEVENQIDAVISVVDQKPVVLSAWLNNTGTEASGDFRVGASVTHRNLFGRDHSGSLSFITSPEGIDDVQQIAIGYRIPIYKLGGSVNLVAVQSDIDTGTVAGVFDVAGRGEVFGLGYSHVFSNLGAYNHGLSVQLSDKLFDNDIQFQGSQLLEDVRSRPLALSYQGSWRNEAGLELSGSISASSNLGGGQFNDERSYELARVGASNDWTKFDIGLNVQFSLKNWLYTAAAKYATTSDRLITGEQFAVGGTSSVRGLEERELRGDEGYQLNFQAWAPEVIKGLRPVAFLDAGRVQNNAPVEGELDSDSVVSVGFLFNWNPINKVTASASYGYLLDGIDDLDTATNASQDGDSKVHFNVTYRF